jgi:hypothetical protein
MKGALVVEIREYQNSREEDLCGLPCSFSFCAWVTEHLAESGHVAFITYPLGLTTSSDTLGGGELSQVPMLRLTPSIGARTSKLKQSLTRSKVTFSWIVEQDGYTKLREMKMTGLGVNQHEAGYWIDLVNTKALLE